MPIDLYLNDRKHRRTRASNSFAYRFVLFSFAFLGQLFLGQLSLSFGDETARIEGLVQERGTRTPIVGVNVYLVPSNDQRVKAVTDSEGRFIIEGVPSGKMHWIINLSGYERLEKDDLLDPQSPSRLKVLYLEKTSYQIYETTITGKEDKRDDTAKTLTAAQFSKLPGSGGDPIRAVQNLPGVNRPAPFQSQVIIQGSAPRDTRYTVNGHEVPLIFHFGGLSSVVIPEALDRVDYLSAGYGPEYGRALGGLVGVWSRPPRTDRLHGFGYMDIFNAGGLVEGPIGEKSSFLFGVRRSYIGNVLGLIAKNNKDFNLTVAPTFSDLTGIFETELTPIDRLRIISVGSEDELKFVLNQPVGTSASLRGNFRNHTAFFRLIPELTHRHSSRTVSRWSLGFGRDWIDFDIGGNYTYISTYALSTRAEVDRKMNDTWTSIWGMDNRFTWAKVDFSIPGSFNQLFSGSATSESDRKIAQVSQYGQQLGFYWRNSFHAEDSPWTLMPSARVDYFNLTHEWIPVPRLAARYFAGNGLSFRTAGGLYAQPPLEQEVDATLGNPDLKAPRAWHLSGGFEKDFREGASRGFVFSSGAFYRYFDQLVIRSKGLVTRNDVITAENYNNDGRGRAYGLEGLMKTDFKPWTGWLSYTLSRSTRFDPTRAEYLFQYDQTHLLTAIASLELHGNWTISTRFRYASGNPTTPIIGSVFDSDSDGYIPIQGGYYSQRLSPFMQLDLRIDKKWIYNTWILSAYLDIQNVLNRANIESIQYSYDYQSNTQVSGLPFLPTFGVKGEF
jgi:hypothetical protein